MEIRQLRAFTEIAKTSNLTEASANLLTSQPAISAQIKALEKELGFLLFHRNARGMSLTSEGSQLLSKAEKILSFIDDFTDTALALNHNTVKSIQISLNTDSEVLRIRQLLDQFSKKLPNVEIHFKDVKSEEIANALANSQIDAGFYYGKIIAPHVTQVKLQSFRMVVVYPPSWNIDEDKLTFEHFSKVQWIWTTKGCPFYKETIEYFEKNGYHTTKIMYVDDELLIGKLVKEGIACSLLAEPIAAQLAIENKVKIWHGVDLTVDLNFGFLKEKKNDTMILKLTSILNKIWKNIDTT